MRKILTFAAAAVALATAAPALAQSAAPGAQAAPSAGAPASASATASAPTLSVGQPVKDKTGVVIGSIAELSGDTATVKMGEQSFAIGASSFVVQDGAAVINATQAELKAMIAKASPPAG
ncbi:hypothetical protein LJR219_002372 [Phenylobacterium sp. LjRoot219]|uniref:hypothetical protein n=1 Tax=Phenylobacterium sp. LjRoot219 TaxID=3342283 RepID=UPI003ECFB21C